MRRGGRSIAQQWAAGVAAALLLGAAPTWGVGSGHAVAAPPVAGPAAPSPADPPPAPGIPEIARPQPGGVPASIVTPPTSSPTTETSPKLSPAPAPSSTLGAPPPAPAASPMAQETPPQGRATPGVVGFLRVEVADPAQVRALTTAFGLKIRQVGADPHVLSVTAPEGADLDVLLARLRLDPRVRSARLEALGFVPPTR